MYYIKQLAKLSGVSPRMLRHYHKINLLQPTYIEDNGYRVYDTQSLALLQSILFFKELDFTLTEIKVIVHSPNFDIEEVLKKQKLMILEKRRRYDRLINTLDLSLEYLKEGKELTKEIFESFSNEYVEKYKEEVRELYKGSDPYKEWVEKEKSYNQNDYNRMKVEQEEFFKLFANNMEDYKSSKVQELVGKWQAYITKNFYECTDEILLSLAEMYISDRRFQKNIDKNKEGLAVFLNEAIVYYCKGKQT